MILIGSKAGGPNNLPLVIQCGGGAGSFAERPQILHFALRVQERMGSVRSVCIAGDLAAGVDRLSAAGRAAGQQAQIVYLSIAPSDCMLVGQRAVGNADNMAGGVDCIRLAECAAGQCSQIAQ